MIIGPGKDSSGEGKSWGNFISFMWDAISKSLSHRSHSCKRTVWFRQKEASMLLHLFTYYKYLSCTHCVVGTALYAGDIEGTRRYSWSSHSSDNFSKHFTGLNPLNSHNSLCGRYYNPHFIHEDTKAPRICITFGNRIHTCAVASYPFCILPVDTLNEHVCLEEKGGRELGRWKIINIAYQMYRALG